MKTRMLAKIAAMLKGSGYRYPHAMSIRVKASRAMTKMKLSCPVSNTRLYSCGERTKRLTPRSLLRNAFRQIELWTAKIVRDGQFSTKPPSPFRLVTMRKFS